MRLLLARHGQTEANLAGRHVPHTDRLTDLGWAQAGFLGLRLQHEPIEVVYFSGSRRTEETLAGVLTHLPAPVVQQLGELHEGDVGSWVSMGNRIRFTEAERLGLPVWRVRPPDGESWEDITERVKRVLKDLLMKHRNQSILIIGHGRINSLTLRLLEGQSWESYSGQQQPHASLSSAEIDDAASRVVYKEDVSHIPEELRTK